MLINPQKKDILEAIKFIVDDQNPLDEKIQRLIHLQKEEKMRFQGAGYTSSINMDQSFASDSKDYDEEETKSII